MYVEHNHQIIFGSVLLGLAIAGQVLAQGGATGAISGTVLDPSGAVVSGADVHIINQDTGVASRATKTDSSGSFTATLLPVGNYTVSVVSPGFQEAKFINVAVRVTETTRMEAKLRPLAVQEKVEVQAQVQTVDTSTATTGQAIDSRTIRDLPLATQNFQQLLTLSAGTNSDLNASASLGRGDVRIQVNGQREDNNNYLIEGISAYRLQRGRTDQHSAAKSRRGAGIQGSNQPVRCHPGTQRGRQH